MFSFYSRFIHKLTASINKLTYFFYFFTIYAVSYINAHCISVIVLLSLLFKSDFVGSSSSDSSNSSISISDANHDSSKETYSTCNADNSSNDEDLNDNAFKDVLFIPIRKKGTCLHCGTKLEAKLSSLYCWVCWRVSNLTFHFFFLSLHYCTLKRKIICT